MEKEQNWTYSTLYNLANGNFRVETDSYRFNILPLGIYGMEKDSLFVTKDDDFKIVVNGTLFYQHGLSF